MAWPQQRLAQQASRRRTGATTGAMTVGSEVSFDCVAEGLFYADELPTGDPAAYRTLVDYVRRQAAWTDAIWIDANRRLALEPLSRWLERVLWRAAYELRTAVICFNAPFDLSRLAWQAGPARTYKPGERVDAFEGGFSFALWSRTHDGERIESRYRPRVAIKSIDSKRSLKGLRAPNRNDEENLVTTPAGGTGTSPATSLTCGRWCLR